MREGLHISGDLADIRLPVLLMSLYKSRETGILYVQYLGFRKALYIQEGQVVFATSSNPDERLGEFLLRRGIITIEQYLDSAALIRPGRRQGEILIEQGALTPESLVDGVRDQVYEIIFNLFTLTMGSYSLEMDEFDTMDLITITMEMPHLVLTGMKRVQSWNTIHAGVGRPETRVRCVATPPPYLSRLDLDTDEEHILGLCRTGMEVGRLLDVSYQNQFETYRTIWILLVLGLIEKAPPSGKVSDAPADDAHDTETIIENYNGMFAYLYRELSSADPEFTSKLEEGFGPIREAYGPLAENQDGLFSYGRLDIDYILSALHRLSEEEREPRLRSFLDEILYAFMFLVESCLPPEEAARLREYLKKQSTLT